jgi:hypothetical protein
VWYRYTILIVFAVKKENMARPVNLLCMNRDPLMLRFSLEVQEKWNYKYNSLLAKKTTFNEFDRVIHNLKPCIETHSMQSDPQSGMFIYTKN